jgi:hypothetical protein
VTERAGVVLIVAAAVACARTVAPPPPPDLPRTVAVLTPGNRTGDPLLVSGGSLLEKYVFRSDRITVPDVIASEARLQLELHGFTVASPDAVEQATGGRVAGSVEAAAEIAAQARLEGLVLWIDVRRWDPDPPTEPDHVIVALTADLIDVATGRVRWHAERPSRPVATPGEIALGPADVAAAHKVMEEMLAPLAPAVKPGS